MGMSAELEIHTRSLSTIEVVGLVVENDGVEGRGKRGDQVLDRLAAHVRAVIAADDDDTAVDDGSLIDEQTDAGILQELLGAGCPA